MGTRDGGLDRRRLGEEGGLKGYQLSGHNVKNSEVKWEKHTLGREIHLSLVPRGTSSRLCHFGGWRLGFIVRTGRLVSWNVSVTN